MGKPEGKQALLRPRHWWKDNIKNGSSTNSMAWCGLDLYGSGYWQVVGCCENGNKASDSITCREFDWLRKYELVRDAAWQIYLLCLQLWLLSHPKFDSVIQNAALYNKGLVTKYMHRFLLSSSPPLHLHQQHTHYCHQIHTKDSFTFKQNGWRSSLGWRTCGAIASLPLCTYDVVLMLLYLYQNGLKCCSCIRWTPKPYLCLRFLYGNSIYTDGQLYFWCLVSFCLPQLLVEFQFTDPFLHHLNTLWLVHFCTP